MVERRKESTCCEVLHFFCKNKLYKINEAEIGQKIRTNLENFEAEKCKDKKKIKRMDCISSKHFTKEWLEYHQNH